MEAIVLIADGIIMGALSFNIIKGIFGDQPLGRILAVIGCIFCGFLYFCFALWANNNVESLLLGVIIIFGPIGLILFMALVAYGFNGKK